MTPLRPLVALLLSATVALAGCDQKGANAPKAVSIDQGSSAQRYPAMLDRQNQRIRDRESRAKEKMGKFSTSAAKLTDTDWAIVEKIVDAGIPMTSTLAVFW